MLKTGRENAHQIPIKFVAVTWQNGTCKGTAYCRLLVTLAFPLSVKVKTCEADFVAVKDALIFWI